MSKYSIGLDLGINNVGWSIVDIDTATIEKCGVRSFNKSDGAKDRRNSRNDRRRLKRRNTRKADLLKLFGEINFPTTNTIDSKLIEKRYKGIHEQITKQDIVNILCYMVTHRGYIPFGDEDPDKVELQGKLPCEYYYALYENSVNNKYRALGTTVKNSDNEKEIRKLIEVQSKFYPKLNEAFVKKLLGDETEKGIFNRKRKFWEGPGSINAYTPYGRFNSDEDRLNYLRKKDENPNYEKYLFEDLIGKCSVNLNEKCASTGNFYAEKFNLLNDFINISFKTIEGLTNQQAFYQVNNTTYKLNKEGLELVFNYCIENDSVTYSRLFKKLFNTTIENVSGYRTNDNNKPEFSTMNIYHSIKKAFIEKNANTDIFKEENIDQYNAIINYMGIVPGNVELINMLSGEFSLSKAEEDALKAAMKTNKPKLEYHSLSEETLKMAINDMQKDCLNYMQVYKKYDYGKKSREEFINRYTKFNAKKDFPMVNPQLIDGIIASPQVKKTLRQAIKVINAIIEEKGSLPYSISIESAKESMNSDKKKQEYIRVQKLKTELHRKAEEYLKSHNLNITNKNIEKVMLWDEFEGHCAYCNKQISKEKFINEDYEIEHILPISASFDNSYENRTIACENCNNNKCKGNKTPLQYLVGGEREAFIKRIEANKKISDLKKRNFLYADDLNKYKIRFFNRNLRDTAYATKEIVKQIKIFNDYLKNVYNKDTRILTLSTPGQFTSSIRKRYELEKDRDAGEKPYHHAVDASIIALLPTTELGKDIIKFQNDAKFFLNPKADDMMKEIGYEMNTYYESKGDIEYDKYIVDLKKITDTNKELFKYSGEVNKEANRGLSDALIKKVIYQGDNYYQINRVDTIYNAKINKTLFDKLFDDSKNETLLCQDANINLYNLLKEIYIKYKTFDNPFLEYCLEVNNLTLEDKFDYLKHGIRSADKGPMIRKLQYYTAINDPYFLEKKNIKKKPNTLIALDGLSQICTRVYYNESKNCFTFLPIPAICTNLKNGKINKEHRLYKQYYQKLIGDDIVKHIVDLYNGNTIEVHKKSGEIIRGEVKGYHKTHNCMNFKNGLYFTKSDKKLIVYDVDPLGNAKIRLTFEIK